MYFRLWGWNFESVDREGRFSLSGCRSSMFKRFGDSRLYLGGFRLGFRDFLGCFFMRFYV